MKASEMVGLMIGSLLGAFIGYGFAGMAAKSIGEDLTQFSLFAVAWACSTFGALLGIASGRWD